MMTSMRSVPLPASLPAPLVVAALVAALVGACSAGADGVGAAPTPTPAFIDSPETAARTVAAVTPLFSAFPAKTAAMIGARSWYVAAPTEAAKPPVDWNVTFSAGWGDCEAGCINVHSWTYRVGADRSVTFVSETGPLVPAAVIAPLSAAVTVTGAGGRVLAGPACGGPVQPGSSACDDRPVGNAVLVVKAAGGTEVARLTTDASGLFRLALQPGDYTLEPQQVRGLMGTPAAIPFTVGSGAETFLDVPYDTGMR